MSTAIDVDTDGKVLLEHPEIIGKLGSLLGQGAQLSLVLRTFGDEIAFTTPTGVDIPVKTVRGWFVVDGHAQPCSEAEIFTAFCTDADTGEPLAPEGGVRYADAWPIEID